MRRKAQDVRLYPIDLADAFVSEVVRTTACAVLRLFWEMRQQKTVPVVPGRDIIVGTGTRVDLRVPDPTVSETHCILRVDSVGVCYVRDLNSKNGTLVNGRRIRSEIALSSGDLVQIGYVTMVYQASNLRVEEETNGA